MRRTRRFRDVPTYFQAVAGISISFAALVVAASAGVQPGAYRGQLADTGSRPSAALKWLDLNAERTGG